MSQDSGKTLTDILNSVANSIMEANTVETTTDKIKNFVVMIAPYLVIAIVIYLVYIYYYKPKYQETTPEQPTYQGSYQQMPMSAYY